MPVYTCTHVHKHTRYTLYIYVYVNIFIALGSGREALSIHSTLVSSPSLHQALIKCEGR